MKTMQAAMYWTVAACFMCLSWAGASEPVLDRFGQHIPLNMGQLIVRTTDTHTGFINFQFSGLTGGGGVLHTDTIVVMRVNFFVSHVLGCQFGEMTLVPWIGSAPSHTWVRVRRDPTTSSRYYLEITDTPGVVIQFLPLPFRTVTGLNCLPSSQSSLPGNAYVTFEVLQPRQASQLNTTTTLAA